MITLTSGTAFIMWLGEQVTERGIGNGISLIIFSGIIVGLPSGISNVIDLVRTDQFSILEVIFLGVIIVGRDRLRRLRRARPAPHPDPAREAGRDAAERPRMSYFPLARE